MHPQLSEALLHERVREFHRAAEISRRAKLARRARHSHTAGAGVATHPAAALSPLVATGRAQTPAEQVSEQASSCAA